MQEEEQKKLSYIICVLLQTVNAKISQKISEHQQLCYVLTSGLFYDSNSFDSAKKRIKYNNYNVIFIASVWFARVSCRLSLSLTYLLI